jgi:hypothetical protein
MTERAASFADVPTTGLPHATLPQTRKRVATADENARAGSAPHSLGGMLWLAGWLFTIGFAKLVWWKILLAIIAWPYFLGTAIH